MTVTNTVKECEVLRDVLNEAEMMYLRALTEYEKAWASEYKQALDTRYNLTITYKKQSMFNDAARHFELVVQDYTKMLGSEHWKTVEVVN